MTGIVPKRVLQVSQDWCIFSTLKPMFRHEIQPKSHYFVLRVNYTSVSPMCVYKVYFIQSILDWNCEAVARTCCVVCRERERMLSDSDRERVKVWGEVWSYSVNRWWRWLLQPRDVISGVSSRDTPTLSHYLLTALYYSQETRHSHIVLSPLSSVSALCRGIVAVLTILSTCSYTLSPTCWWLFRLL